LSLWRVDVGGGAMLYSHGTPGAPRPFAMPGGGARAIFGRDLAGSLSVGWNRGAYAKFATVDDFSIDELEAELGVLWRFDLSPVELAPYLSAGAQRRTASDKATGARPDIVTPVATLGVSTRVALWQFVGAFVDVGVRAGAAGPVVGTVSVAGAAVDDVIDPVGARATAGVSFAF
jgi:hypothetical protein